jgi:porin
MQPKSASSPQKPAEARAPPTRFDDMATGGWSGQRQRLQDRGIEVGAGFTVEGFEDFRGGQRAGSAVASATWDLSIALQTEELVSWRGGRLYADFEQHAGSNPTTRLVGDLQAFDKLNASPYVQLFEVWYEQMLLGDTLRIKVGKVDCNSEFSVVDDGLPFLNSSAQVTPTAFLFPTTPYPAPSANVFASPIGGYYASFGAYYSNRSVEFGVISGEPEDVQRSDSGWFIIGETGLRWGNGSLLGRYSGNLKFGGWGHTGTFTRFDGFEQRGTLGYYAIVNQTLWQPPGAPGSGRGLHAFAEHGRTQQTIHPIDWHSGGGVSWQGFSGARPDDTVGLGLQYAHISTEAGLPHSYELAMEAFYQLSLAGWAAVMPDLQSIVHPGGRYPNAVVGTLRLSVRL